MQNNSQLDDFINMLASAGIHHHLIDTVYKTGNKVIGWKVRLNDCEFHFDDVGNLERVSDGMKIGRN